MKKRYFLIGSIVAIAFAAVVMSCNPIDRESFVTESSCLCKVTYGSSSQVYDDRWTADEMKDHGISNYNPKKCEELADFLKKHDGAKTATCKLAYD